MGLPGIKYEVFAFLGKRNAAEYGIGLVEGYRIKLYDSSDPAPPLILNPLHEISENTAGTLTFILHRLAKTTVYYKNQSDMATSTYPTDQYIKPFMYMKQTEIVIFRSNLVLNQGSEARESRKEIWAGRITSISKDLYGDWSISAEGDLSYLNDVTMSYGRKSEKKTTPEPDVLFKMFLNNYNSVISDPSIANQKITYVGQLPKLPGQDIPPVASFPQLNRKILIGNCNWINQETKVIAATTANLDDGYTVSEGPIWGNLQVLLDRYGGHFEMVRQIENNEWVRRLTWTASGENAYSEQNQRAYIKGYHEYVENKSQHISFSENLLDYSEEVNGDDMFTVLIPHGSQTTTTTTDENGNTKTTTGDNITISTVNNGSPRLFNQNIVEKYGFIEKIETWSISNPQDLKKVATSYYNDYRIGAFKITIKAYDLKNLLSQETDTIERNKLLELNSLYLYDSVKIVKTGASDVADIRDMYLPIQGIRLPLDKFPTDTEFTISNARNRRGILQPGTLQSKQEPEQKKNDTKDGNEEPEVITDDPIPSINPWAHENGIDSDLPHYPPVYLDHAHNYWKGVRTSVAIPNGETKSISINGYPAYQSRTLIPELRYDTVPFSRDGIPGANMADMLYANKTNLSLGKYTYIVDKNRPSDTSNPRHLSESTLSLGQTVNDTFFGYSSGTFAQGISQGEVQAQFNSTFYSDNLSDTRAYMRIRTNAHADEAITNWFEKAYKNGPDANTYPQENLDPFISADTDQYQESWLTDAGKANITTGTGLWHQFSNSAKDIPKITFTTGPETAGTSLSANDVRDAIYEIPCFGSTVGSILGDIGISLIRTTNGTSDQKSYLYFRMDYSGETSETKKIGVKSIKYRPLSTDMTPGKEYIYAVGYRQLNSDSVAVYYLLFEKPMTSSSENDANTKRQTQINNIAVRCGFTSLNVNKKDYSVTINITPGVGGEGLVSGDVSFGGRYYVEEYDSNLGMTVYKWATGTEENVKQTTLGKWVNRWNVDKAAAESQTPPAAFPIDSVARRWVNSVVGSGSSGLPIGPVAILKAALIETASIPSQADVENQVEYEERMAYAQAYYGTAPLMIISKCTDVGTGTGDYYGVTFFEETASGGMELAQPESHEQNVLDYVLTGVNTIENVGVNTNGKPYLICKDTLETANYLFGKHNNEYAVINSNCVPAAIGNTAPLMILGKCGGRHTARIANGLYMMLSGHRYSSHVTVTEPISPISGTKEYGAPKERNEKHSERDSDNTPWKRWYYGSDMVTEADTTGRNEWVTPWVSDPLESGYFNTSPEKLKEFYYNSRFLQPLVIGADTYVKITPNIYARLYEASETEGDS